MIILECSKADYWGPAFVVPLLCVAFALALLLIELRQLFFSYRDAEPLRKPVLRAVASLLTLICLFGVHFPTFRYGVFLPTVSEDDVQYRQGYVTSITEVPLSPRYSISNGAETYRASLVQVDGDVFYFLHADGLEIGQEIVISYLPRCNMVLTSQIVGN